MRLEPEPRSVDLRGKRLLIFVVAYNAESTIEKVLSRIPASLHCEGVEVLIIDDSSRDDTFANSLRYQQGIGRYRSLFCALRKTRVTAETKNLATATRSITGSTLSRWFMVTDSTHRKNLPALITPLLNGEADAVFGSRMIDKQEARRGGMPMYKWIGNQLLTNFQNRVLGTKLSEFHTGYRIYSTEGACPGSVREEHQRFPFRYRNHHSVRSQKTPHRRIAYSDLLRRRDLLCERVEICLQHLLLDHQRPAVRYSFVL